MSKIAAFVSIPKPKDGLVFEDIISGGKPLFFISLEKLCLCDLIDEVYIATDAQHILDYAPHLPYQRFENEAQAISSVAADVCVHLSIDMPFISTKNIQEGVAALLEKPQYDAVVLAMGNTASPEKEASGLLITRGGNGLPAKEKIAGGKVYTLEGTSLETFQIRSKDDVVMAEYIAKGQQAEIVSRYQMWATVFSSCLFSDILDMNGVGGVITSLSPNMPNAKLMGRANTLKLRKLAEGEDYKGIYDALKTYSFVSAGEIIIVENEMAQRAYFGELNANLAMRAGAAGAIIGGVTRDSSEVFGLGLPVFAKGYCCADVRGIATMERFNCPIQIDGVHISPGDLLFADRDGIAVIPRKDESWVLKEAMAALQKENRVLAQIHEDMDAFHIYNETGEF